MATAPSRAPMMKGPIEQSIDSAEAINARLGRLYPSVNLSSIPMQWRKIDLFNGEVYSIELRENRTVVEYQVNYF